VREPPERWPHSRSERGTSIGSFADLGGRDSLQLEHEADQMLSLILPELAELLCNSTVQNLHM
jgi:hypothetical protein